MKKRIIFTFCGIVFITIIVMGVKYILASEKRIIKQEILATKKAIESKDENGTVRYISQKFIYGDLDKEGITQEVSTLFEEAEKINVKISKIRINIQDKRAYVSFKLMILVTYGGMTGPVIGGIAGPANVECLFVKYDEWLVERIEIIEQN